MAQYERLFYSPKNHVINYLVQMSTLNFPTRTSHHIYYGGSGEGRGGGRGGEKGEGGEGPTGARKPPRRGREEKRGMYSLL